MKGQHRGASAGGEHGRQLFQKGIERLKLAVHIDAQRLKGALARAFHRLLPLALWQEPQGAPDRLDKLPRGRDGGFALHADDGACNALRVRFVGVFDQHGGQLLLAQLGEALGARHPRGGVEPQVERTVLLEGKAALRVVDLHGGHAEIGQHEIKLHTRRDLVERREVHVPDGQNVLAEAQLQKPPAGLFQLDRIDVDGVQMPLPLKLLQHFRGVAAVAEGGVAARLAGPDPEHAENLLHHDGNVRPRRRLPACDHLLYVLPVRLGIQLLVFLLEPAGMGPLVPFPALMLLLLHVPLLHPSRLSFSIL